MQRVLSAARNFTSSSQQKSEEGVGEEFPAVNASTRAFDFQQRMLEQERAVLELSKRALQDLDLSDVLWAHDAVVTYSGAVQQKVYNMKKNFFYSEEQLWLRFPT